jgi:glucose-1-phosphate cytidylyltransferase
MNHLPSVIILAGGLGTRLSEETMSKPKPMVAIRGRPILEYIIEIYLKQGFTNFIVATGYRSELIDEWACRVESGNTQLPKCKVQPHFTGLGTQTSGRIRQVFENFGMSQAMVTYGDGLANVDLRRQLKFHSNHGRIATVTSVRPPARFGHIVSKDGLVTYFGEKTSEDSGWINGGFFVLDARILKYLSDDFIPFETEPMTKLVKDQQLMTVQHLGFWQPMDTLREKLILEELAGHKRAPWTVLEEHA